MTAINVSKAVGYAVLQRKEVAVGKAVAYAVLTRRRLALSKAVAYALLKDAPPDPYDLEIRATKAVAFVLMTPGENGPISYATSAAADILMQTNDRLRVTHRTLEVAHGSAEPGARVTEREADALINATAGARIGALVFDVLRSTAEVTVQGLITTQVLDVAYANFGNARTATVYAEVLIASDMDGEGFGSVALMN